MEAALGARNFSGIEGADRPIDEKIARPPSRGRSARQSQANPPLAPPASDASKLLLDMLILPICDGSISIEEPAI